MTALYRHFGRRPRAPWGEAIALGVAIGLTRAVLAVMGWYVVERTGGPLQIPAYALAMLAWPEGMMLGRQRGPAGPAFFVVLGVVLTASSIIVVVVVAFVAHLRRRGSPTVSS